MPPKFRREGSSSRGPEREALLDGLSDDDDFFLRGPSTPSFKSGDNTKIHTVRSQVDEVVDIMQTNVGKVLERGERLEDLQYKSDSLSSNAQTFRVKAQGLRRQMWWKECRMRILLAVIVTIILIIIFVPIIIHFTKNNS